MKVVVIEDEALIRNGLAHMIPSLNPEYEVVGTAEDGREGYQLVIMQKPDLIIMDIQMPSVDGLTMLARLREQGYQTKVVVLTAYSDFHYAKQAIELGIENYLLKPIKIPELKKTLEIIRESVDLESGQEQLLSLERIIRSSVLDELPIDEKLNQVTKERFGLDIHETLVLFSVWLGSTYETYASMVADLIRESASHAAGYRCCVVESERYCLVLGALYQIEDVTELQKQFAESIVPMICGHVRICPVFTWAECDGLKLASQGFAKVLEEKDWNLSYQEGTLITPEKIENLVTVPLKYPIDLENQLYQVVINRDQKGLEQNIRQLFKICTEEPHRPDEIREACTKYCLSLVSLMQKTQNVKDTVSSQAVFQRISQAYTWKVIIEVIGELYHHVDVSGEEDETVSLMVKRARQMIEEYYNQGITLEETAQKLCVSDEYLSTQFKKETGASFTETVRKYRIEKVKELLQHSNLKLNQIANLVGYSDPKYMSRVFREEVGVLPADYRKSHI